MLLHERAPRVHDRGEQREQQPGDVRAGAGGRVHADQHHAEKGDRRPDDQGLRESLAQEQPAEDHDHERCEVHDHRGGARIERALCRVEGQVVDAEPADTPDDDEPPVPLRRKADAVAQCDDRERHAADGHAQQCQRARVVVRARAADADERRGPQHDRHQSGDEHERSLRLRDREAAGDGSGLRHGPIVAEATDIGDMRDGQPSTDFRPLPTMPRARDEPSRDSSSTE